MNFGRVEISQLNAVDFKLLKEPSSNNEVLSGHKSKDPKFYVGFSSWGKKEWVGKIYPKGTKDSGFLEQYVRHYNFVELNATHYKLYKDADLQKWIDTAKDQDFKFAPKYYQGISHFGSFKDKDFLTHTFLESMRHFGNALGPIFLQVSDKFGPGRSDELFEYLQKLPKDIQFFLEVRHPDWFADVNAKQLFSTLTRLGIGSVIADAAGRRDVCHMHLTVPKTFIRFIANNMHSTDFKRLDEWVARIKYWIDLGLQEVYFVIHCLNEAFAPELSVYLIDKLNKECNAGLKEVEFVDQAK